MKVLRNLLCLSFLFVILVACNNSNNIVGTWKPVEERCDDGVLTFTEENTVRYQEDNDILGGRYEKLDDNLFSITFTNGITADAILSTERDAPALNITYMQGETCQYYKSE